MLASNSAGSDPAGPHAAGWRPYALALLPLALAGALPWWATALLCLLYGLGVRFAVWQQGRALIGLLIVGLTVVSAFPELKAGPHQQIWQLLENLQWQYLARLLMLALLSWAASDLEDGERRGLWLMLLAGLLAPQPLLVVALAAGAVALPGLDDRRASAAKWHSAAASQASAAAQRLWLWPLLFVLGVVALTLALPRYAPTTAPRPEAGNAAPAKPKPAAPPSTPPPSAQAATHPQTAPAMSSGASAQALRLPPSDLLVGLALLLSVLLFVNLISRTARKSDRVNLVDILMVAALLLTFALWFVFAAASQRPGQAGVGEDGQTITATGGRAGGHSAQRVVRRPALVPVVWALFWLITALLVAGIALLAWTLWQQYQQRPRLAAPAEAEPLPPDATPEQLALHRVRVAYRQASEALGSRGWGRGVAETPLGYAARLGAQFPALAGPLGTLTAAYDPVRYGGKVTEDEADSAEAAALAVQNHAAQLPPPAENLPAEPLPHTPPLQETP